MSSRSLNAFICSRVHRARYAPAIRMGNETRFVLNACVLPQGVRIDHGIVECQGCKLVKLVDQVKHLHRHTSSVLNQHTRDCTLTPRSSSPTPASRDVSHATSLFSPLPLQPRRDDDRAVSGLCAGNTVEFLNADGPGGELYHLRQRRRRPTAPLRRLRRGALLRVRLRGACQYKICQAHPHAGARVTGCRQSPCAGMITR